jgi:hypothetical protein
MKNYSTSEVAEILGKSRQYVWIQIISKNLLAEKIGNYYSISEANLYDFIDSHNNQLINDNNLEAKKES